MAAGRPEHARPLDEGRRRLLTLGVTAGAAALLGFAGYEVASPGSTGSGESESRRLHPCAPDGAAGTSLVGSFFSRYRGREEFYTLAYPPGFRQGDPLPLLVYLHGYGGSHSSPYGGLRPVDALALRPSGRPLAPMAMVVPDGGNGYWHAHPGDDPMGMLVHELIPRCQAIGLGRIEDGSAVLATGISMGGYGAILLAEKYPRLVAEVAAISPAVWSSWSWAESANPHAYTSEADYLANDVCLHTADLAGKPVRVASGLSDGFHGGVVTLAAYLPKGAVVVFAPGGHDSAFFRTQVAPSLSFLSEHLRVGKGVC